MSFSELNRSTCRASLSSNHAPKSEAKTDPFGVRLFFPQYIDYYDNSEFVDEEEEDEDDPAEDQVKPQVVGVKMEQPDVQLGEDAAPDPKSERGTILWHSGRGWVTM